MVDRTDMAAEAQGMDHHHRECRSTSEQGAADEMASKRLSRRMPGRSAVLHR